MGVLTRAEQATQEAHDALELIVRDYSHISSPTRLDAILQRLVQHLESTSGATREAHRISYAAARKQLDSLRAPCGTCSGNRVIPRAIGGVESCPDCARKPYEGRVWL